MIHDDTIKAFAQQIAKQPNDINRLIRLINRMAPDNHEYKDHQDLFKSIQHKDSGAIFELLKAIKFQPNAMVTSIAKKLSTMELMDENQLLESIGPLISKNREIYVPKEVYQEYADIKTGKNQKTMVSFCAHLPLKPRVRLKLKPRISERQAQRKLIQEISSFATMSQLEMRKHAVMIKKHKNNRHAFAQYLENVFGDLSAMQPVHVLFQACEQLEDTASISGYQDLFQKWINGTLAASSQSRPQSICHAPSSSSNSPGHKQAKK